MELLVSIGVVVIIMTAANIYIYLNYNRNRDHLIEEKSQLEKILSDSGFGVLRTDRDGEIHYMTDAIYRFLDVIDMPMEIGDPIDILITRINQYLEEEEALSKENLTSNGEEKQWVFSLKGVLSNITYYEVTVLPYYRDGELDGQVIRIMDVTAREVSRKIDNAIIRISVNVSAFKNIEDVLKYFSAVMEEVIDIDYVFATVTEERDMTYFINHTENSFSSKIIKSHTRHPFTDMIVGSHEVLHMDKRQLEEVKYREIFIDYEKKPESLIACSIPADMNHSAGAFGLLFCSEVVYPELIMSSLEVIAGYIGQVIERLRVEDQIHRLAFYDHLTGLPNRNMYIKHLEQEIIEVSLRGNRILGILFLDFSGLKRINDEYSHHVGDRLLKMIADDLRQASDDIFFIGRLGGDEFGIFTSGSTRVEVECVAKQVLEIINQPWVIDGHTVHVTGNIGISIYGEHSIHTEELIHQADEALAEAKKAGKSQYAFYE